MKKIIALLALTLSLSPTLADSVATTVTINGTVANSCVFDAAATTAATFNYAAATGSSAVVPGTATLYCNKGTLALISPNEASVVSPVTLTKGADTLRASVAVSTLSSTVPVVGGTYAGGDKRVYNVTPAAAANQWSASSGAYTGTTTITVTF